jgi:hypothetical protein
MQQVFSWASSFLPSFQIRRDAAVSHLRKNVVSPVTGSAALPVTAAPVPVVPMAAMPAPVATVPMPVPVVAPAYLFGLEAFYFALGGDSGTGSLSCRQPFIFRQRMRRKRRGLRTRRQRGCARGYSNSEFQKVTAFHDISSFVDGE